VQEQERFSHAELHNFRVGLMSQFLKTAEMAPYWRIKFLECNVNPRSDDPFAELAKLPILTKEEVKRNIGGITNPAINRRSVRWRHTSGTTGSGLVFPETAWVENITWAFWWRYRRWHGLTQRTRCGYFGGRSLVAVNSNRPPFWRLNLPGNQIMFSAYHLSFKTAPAYLKALQKYNVQWLHGYPSIIYLLSQYVLEGELKVDLPDLQCITTGAENLSDRQKDIIRRAFGVPVVQHYGQAEGVANISECQYGQLHVDEDFSAVELVPHQFHSNSYRLIGTNWINSAFPLLRYDTGDIVIKSDQTCSCGRPGRVIESIDGRQEDYLVLPNGAHVGRLDHIFKEMVNIREAQFFQECKSLVTIRVVRGVSYSKRDEVQLLKEIYQRIGSTMIVKIEYVNSIARGSNGKLRLVLSTLKKDLKISKTN
jgi:phenylacetate-CoA ligase